MRQHYKAWVSDGTHRRELYSGRSASKALEATGAAIAVLRLFALTGKTYAEMSRTGFDAKTIWHQADFADGKRVTTTPL